MATLLAVSSARLLTTSSPGLLLQLSSYTFELRQLVREVALAWAQVMRTGSDAQLAKAREVLADARRQLYRILAKHRRCASLLA